MICSIVNYCTFHVNAKYKLWYMIQHKKKRIMKQEIIDWLHGNILIGVGPENRPGWAYSCYICWCNNIRLFHHSYNWLGPFLDWMKFLRTFLKLNYLSQKSYIILYMSMEPCAFLLKPPKRWILYLGESSSDMYNTISNNRIFREGI